MSTSQLASKSLVSVLIRLKEEDNGAIKRVETIEWKNFEFSPVRFRFGFAELDYRVCLHVHVLVCHFV